MHQRIFVRQYVSSPRKVKSGYEGKERLQGIAEGTIALLVGPTHQPRCFPVETSARGSTVA